MLKHFHYLNHVLFKNYVSALQKRYKISITKRNRLIFFHHNIFYLKKVYSRRLCLLTRRHFQEESSLQVISLYFENCKEHINVGKGMVKTKSSLFCGMKAYKGVDLRLQSRAHPEFFTWEGGWWWWWWWKGV
jgi:hypothetical protein